MTRRMREDRGAVIILTALSLGFIMVATALTIDLGRQILRRREMQAIADVVSLDMSRNLNDRTVAEITADPAWEIQLQRSAARNNFSRSGLDYELGHVETAGGSETFVSDMANTSSRPTAVRITAQDSVAFFFVPGSGSVSRSAVGEHDVTVDYEFGSYLASVDPTQASLLNQVLARALGKNGDFSFDAVSYQGLAAGRVSIRQISTAMGLGSPDALANSTVNARRFFNATADAMQANGGSTAAVTAMRNVASSVNTTTEFEWDDIARSSGNVSQGGGSDAFDTQISVQRLLTASAFAINGSNFIDVPSVNVNVPGFGAAQLRMKVISAPVFVFGARVGEVAFTSQVSSTLTLPIAALDAGTGAPFGLTGLTNLSLSGQVVVAEDAGNAAASPQELNCGTSVDPSQDATIRIAASPVQIAASADITLSAQVPVFGPRTIARTTANPAPVTSTGSNDDGLFVYTDDFLPTVGTGSTKRLGAVSPNLSTMLQPTAVNTQVLFLPTGFVNNQIINAQKLVLNSKVFSVVTDRILPFLNDTLGVNYGGADVGALDMNCAAVKLAI